MEEIKFDCLDIWKKNGQELLVMDPDYNSFFYWFGNNISKNNLLSAEEILQCDDMKRRDIFIQDVEMINKKMEMLGGDFSTDESTVDELQIEFQELNVIEELLKNVRLKLSETESKLDTELSKLNSQKKYFELNNRLLTQTCKEKAAALEQLQLANFENINHIRNCISYPTNPPLLWCHMNLDEYCLNSDSVARTIKLRTEERLKMVYLMDEDDEKLKMLYDLQNIQNSFFKHSLAEFGTECDLRSVNHIIGIIEKPFQPMKFSQMQEQTERLLWENEDTQEHIDTLDEAVNAKMKDLALIEAKFCELEGNQERHRNAKKRLEMLQRISKPVSDILLISEVLWLSLHLETEKIKTVLENTSSTQYENDSKQCTRNMEIVSKMLANSSNHASEDFSNEFMKMAKNFYDLNQVNLNECIELYKMSTNNHNLLLKHIVSDSYQMHITKIINDFNSTSLKINHIIGNGPLGKPTIWDISIVADMELQKRKSSKLTEYMRQLRTDFFNQYHKPYNNDDLWKRRHLLWIWFLTDQNKFLEVFQTTMSDLKKINNQSNNSMSGISGLKRQNREFKKF